MRIIAWSCDCRVDVRIEPIQAPGAGRLGVLMASDSFESLSDEPVVGSDGTAEAIGT